jgi:tetratricopeptide (TPR) repeat protein
MNDDMASSNVNVKACVNTINKLSTLKRTPCGYCGNENAAIGDLWICFHCESVNYTSMLGIKLNDPDLQASLSKVNGYLSDGELAKATETFDYIASKYKEPQFLYNSGLLYLQYSNSEIAKIRYDRHGFMEENAVFRESGSKLTSRALMILNKASEMCLRELNTGTSHDYMAYTYFIINIKLGKPNEAKRAIDIIEKFNNKYLATYANMVLSAELGKFHETIEYAGAQLKSGQFSANSFYYIAWSLFKLGKFKDSMQIMDALNKQTQNNSVIALTNEIAKALSN